LSKKAGRGGLQNIGSKEICSLLRHIRITNPTFSLKRSVFAYPVKQKQLTHIIPQANLSAVLSGKRGLTLLQVGKISVFFRVSPALFIPSEE
jgi:HTH-type transcriptional regulator/antitoxin HigA